MFLGSKEEQTCFGFSVSSHLFEVLHFAFSIQSTERVTIIELAKKNST